jgi:carbamate kinase
MGELIVVAIGGHSLVDEDRSRLTSLSLLKAAGGPVRHLAGLVCDGRRMLIVHGNGPQVGMSLLRSALAAPDVEPLPLASCVAETQGTIGLRIQNVLEASLEESGCEHRVIPIVTRCLVDRDDPAFDNPVKPVGPVLTDAEVERGQAKGWTIAIDKGRGPRRVVASPKPIRIYEEDAARALLDAGFVVLAGGGGGIPVVQGEDRLHGARAVIDKDYTAALLATRLNAQALVILTSIEGVYQDFGGPDEALISELSLAEGRAMIERGDLGEGSMKPKVDAALQFVADTGGRAVITTAHDALEAIEGRAGTTIVP